MKVKNLENYGTGGRAVVLARQDRQARWRRILWHGLLGILAWIAVTGLTAARTHVAPDIWAIKERGVLIVAMFGQDRPPFFFVDERGELAGIDVDLAADIARQLGVKVEFLREAEVFDDVVRLVAEGRADVAISKLSVTMRRAEQLLYTRPYVTLRQGMLINRVRLAAIQGRKGEPLAAVNSPDVSVGVLAGSSYVEFVEMLVPRAQVVEIEPKEALFQAVFNGDVHAVLYDENEIKQYIYQSPDRLINLELAMIPGAEDDIAMAVSWRTPHLHAWLNQYMAQNRIAFDIDELIARYR